MPHDLQDPDDLRINPSTAAPLEDVIGLRLSRRAFLGMSATAGALHLLGCDAVSAPVAAQAPAPGPAAPAGPRPLDFQEIPWQSTPDFQVPPGYRYEVLARWGDPLEPGLPPFHPSTLTPEGQIKRFGTGCDYTAFFPDPADASRGLLCVNHEYPSRSEMFPGLEMTPERLRTEMLSLGVSVLALRRGADGRWQVDLADRRNRRITPETAMVLCGPAAGHPRLRTADSPDGRRTRGTFGNCAGGVTPWGTYLTAEENVQELFHGDPAATAEAANHRRFGLTGKDDYGYHAFDPRFNLQQDPQQPLHFGWIVEIDPRDPARPPRKLTALGRCKHECATTALAADGRLAVYTGDDQVFEYLYKYVSREAHRAGDRAHNERLLENGVLHAARFDADGTLAWLPLVHGQGPLDAAHGFASDADVLLDIRRAADLLGATPMDRPEDIEVSPVSGKVYVFLTGNPKRGADQVNPANPLPQGVGHILELGADHGAAATRWELLLHCGHRAPTPDNQSRYHPQTSGAGRFAYPDNGAFDPSGRLWIVTDSYGMFEGFPDGVWATQVDGDGRAQTRHFANCPVGAEGTGPTFTPDGRALFLSIQHPGGGNGKEPLTRWPDFQADMPPRSSVVVIRREDGGVVGG